MLNLKILFPEAGENYKVENLAHFEKDAFFDKIDTSSVFRNFRSEERIR